MRVYKNNFLFFYFFCKRFSLEEYIGQKLKDLCIVALYPHTYSLLEFHSYLMQELFMRSHSGTSTAFAQSPPQLNH